MSAKTTKPRLLLTYPATSGDTSARAPIHSVPLSVCSSSVSVTVSVSLHRHPHKNSFVTTYPAQSPRWKLPCTENKLRVGARVLFTASGTQSKYTLRLL